MSDAPAHSLFGASVMNRREHCPGSAAAEHGRDKPPGFAARKGTVVHSMIEHAAMFGADIENWAGVSRDDGAGGSITVDDEMIANARAAARRIQDLSDEILIATNHRPYMVIEERVALDHIDAELFGTIDAGIITAKHVAVFDYKNGYLDVPIVDDLGRPNIQPAYYALGLLRWAYDRVIHIEPDAKLTLCIFQPAQGGMKRWDGSVLDLFDAATRIKAALAAGRAPGAPRVPGSWCKFCAFHADCPEAQANAFERAKLYFRPDDSKAVALASPPMISDADLLRAREAVPVLRDWCKAVEDEFDRRGAAGSTFPGWQMSETYGHRAWRDPKEAAEEILRVAKVTPNAIFDMELKSPAQIEKIRPEGFTPGQWKAFVADRTVKPRTGQAMRREGDKVIALPAPAQYFQRQDVK